MMLINIFHKTLLKIDFIIFIFYYYKIVIMEEIITLMEDLNINKIKQIIYILCDNKKIKLKDISTDFFIFLLNLSEDDEEIITSFLINNYSELMFLLNTPCDFAVEHDFVELLVYLNENNYNINENIILDAAGGGLVV